MNKPELKPRFAGILMGAVALIAGTTIVAPFYLSRRESLPDGSSAAWKLITTHDLPHFVPIMEQFDKVLRSGVLYPRWNPDFNFGYGTATANFYPPGTFYVASLINAVVHDWVITLFIICALSLGASGIAFYALSRTSYGKLSSAAAALFYMLLPFHQLDLYWRGAIPEFVGYAFMPVILYFALRLGSEGRLRHYAALGLFHGVYLMSHIPVAYLFTYVLAFYAVVWAMRDKDLRIALRIAGGMAISLLVSAIYWMPAALEGKHAYEWASAAFPYHYTYISMAPTTDTFNRHIQEVFNYNALALIAAVVILLGLPKSTTLYSEQSCSPEERRTQSHTKTWIILGVLTPFMTTSFSIPISKLIPKIQITTPPFRWLAISCLFTSLLVAASIDLLRRHQGTNAKRQLAYKLSLGAVIVLNIWLTAHGIISGALANPTYVPPTTFVDGGFIPKDATLPDRLPNTAAVVISPAGGASEIIRWEPQDREIAVKTDVPSTVRLKTYNFPGWIAQIDGQVATISSDNDGVQLIDVPPGIHTIRVSIGDTLPRKLGAALSVVALLVVLALIALDFLRSGRKYRNAE